MYTVETDTELYNRLVPWGIATHVRSNGIKRAIRHGYSAREQRNGREVELREIHAATAAIDIDLERHNLNRMSQTIMIDSPSNGDHKSTYRSTVDPSWANPCRINFRETILKDE